MVQTVVLINSLYTSLRCPLMMRAYYMYIASGSFPGLVKKTAWDPLFAHVQTTAIEVAGNELSIHCGRSLAVD